MVGRAFPVTSCHSSLTAVTEVACDSRALRGLGTAFLRLGLRQTFRISRYVQTKCFECSGVGQIRMHNPTMPPWHNAIYATVSTNKTSKTNNTTIASISGHPLYSIYWIYCKLTFWIRKVECGKSCEAWTWCGACLFMWQDQEATAVATQPESKAVKIELRLV